MMFNFHVNQRICSTRWPSADARAARRLRWLATKPRPATVAMGSLSLRNHDELDLGRLSEKQRQAVFAAFGPDKDDAAV